MNILSQKFTVEGLGEFTNMDLVHHYNLVHDIDELGNMIHPKTLRYVGNLMDYRKKFVKEMKLQKNRRAYQTGRTELLKAAMPEIVEQMRSDLYSTFGDRAFINKTQPNISFPEIGLKVYIICGWTHRVGFAHDEFNAEELTQIVQWDKVQFDEIAKRQILCNGFRESVEIIEIVNSVVDRITNAYTK